MAELYPFSNRTVELLRAAPAPGQTHRWLAKVACGLRHVLDADTCFAFLRECCDKYVHHRVVPDEEIEAAVDFAYEGDGNPKPGALSRSIEWPQVSLSLIERVLRDTKPLFDPDSDTALTARDVLPRLFHPHEFVCVGPTSRSALVRSLSATLPDAGLQQFIVPNPMRGRSALNFRGKPSPRCQNNTGPRRHLVIEFDSPTLTKPIQAVLLSKLAEFVPLIMVVDSGGKSLHGWFCVGHLGLRDQARLFAVGCLLGCDPTRWDICGWLRMPGGLRQVEGVPAVRQRIIHFAR
ncbi:MAG: hypothetical protein M5U12_12335 [Verrucomicrobia bacterium]|nr:hypothetical protein [Verrucomicrobiota bacterium]